MIHGIRRIHKIIAAVFLTASKFTQPSLVSTLTNDLRLHVNAMPKEPEPVGQVRKSKFKAQWEEAMKSEFASAIRMGTFRWVEKGSGEGKIGDKPLPLKWVLKYKTGSGGFIQRFKARLCARRDLQATTHDTYASTLALRVFRLMPGGAWSRTACGSFAFKYALTASIGAIAAHFDLEMEQMGRETPAGSLTPRSSWIAAQNPAFPTAGACISACTSSG